MGAAEVLAFVFPGQGAQRPGMGRAVAQAFAVSREVFEQADDVLGFSISRLCFEGPAEELTLTAHAQPAILTTSIAVLRAVQREVGLAPDAVAGHSLGEISALVCAGSLDFADAVRLAHHRGRFMQEAVPAGRGAMCAVLDADPELLETLRKRAAAGQVLALANDNSPRQSVLSGETEAVDRFVALAEEQDLVVRALRVSAPFHCRLMAPAAERLGELLKDIALRDAVVPVFANVEACHNTDASRIAELLVRQVTAPVRWRESVQAMVAGGVTEVIELGPGRTLQGLVRDAAPDLRVASVQEPADVAALHWVECGDGARLRRDGVQAHLAPGLDWDFHDASAHGF